MIFNLFKKSSRWEELLENCGDGLVRDAFLVQVRL